MRPGSTHDLTAARDLALPTLYPARIPVVADQGYQGAGIGRHVPVRQPTGSGRLDPDTRTVNLLLARLPARGERGTALLKSRWTALRHVSFDPHRIGDIVQTTLVLTQQTTRS